MTNQITKVNNRTELKRADGGFFQSLIMPRTERVNKGNRGINEYKPNQIEAFFPDGSGVGNMLISGGIPKVRNAAICAQIGNAINNGLPVIVLHEGDHYLERIIRNFLSGTNYYEEISQSRPTFEPMYELSGLEISNEIVQSTPKEFDMKFNVKYYLDGVADFMNRIGKNTSFHMYLTCPHMEIFDKVDNAQMSGRISDDAATKIKSKLMMGQSENLKLESALANFEQEMSSIMWRNGSSYPPVNIISSIKRKKVLCFDVVSLSNQMLANTIVYQLKLALTKGMPYVLILDSLTLGFNEQFKDFVQMNSNNVALMISSDDLYALTGGDDKLFDTFVGNSPLTFILSHKAGNSAKKWADVIGQYDAWIESYSTNYGTQSNPFQIFSSHSRGRSTSQQKNREYIVKPERISRMNDTEAFVLSRYRNETAHIQLLI